MYDIDKLSKNRFEASFMNDSKWFKLLENLTDNLDFIYVNYKLINNETIRSTLFETPDIKPFFIEPYLYKEVEWIEFPCKYILELNKRESRKYTKTEKQDILLIGNLINSIGEFKIEKRNNSIKLYAYL